jgi:hypothetical protein
MFDDRNADFCLRLMERQARSLGVRVVSFKVHYNSVRALGRVEYGAMDAYQRFLMRGGSRLILALAAQEVNAEARELALIETSETMIFGFRLEWRDAITGQRREAEGYRKLLEIESWD